MRGKWVDNSDYFGPDRRNAAGKRRWSDRRRYDEALPHAPPITSMLRRLRVQILGMATPEDKQHVMQLATAAMRQADIMQRRDAADIIRAVASSVMSADIRDPNVRGRLDSQLIEALNLVSPR